MIKRMIQRVSTAKQDRITATIIINDGDIESVVSGKHTPINSTSSDTSTSFSWYDDEVDEAFQHLEVREQSEDFINEVDEVMAEGSPHVDDETDSVDEEIVASEDAIVASINNNETLRQFHLLQAKGNESIRLGRLDESLQAFTEATELLLRSASASSITAAEKAKLLFIMGRLCVLLRQPRKAIDYFSQELEVTKSTLGFHHLNVSLVLHEIACLYDDGLSDYGKALDTYEEAYRVEYGVLQQCQLAKQICTECQRCNELPAKERQQKTVGRGRQLRRRRAGDRDTNDMTTTRQRCCPGHLAIQCEVAKRIRETKRCQGRLHYKLGDLDKALQTLKPFNVATS